MTNGKQIKNKELLKMFCDERIETALQTRILNKKEYSDMNKESIEIYAYAQQLGFTAKQFLVFDQAVAIAMPGAGCTVTKLTTRDLRMASDCYRKFSILNLR